MNVRVDDPFFGHQAVSVTSLITPVLLCGGGGTRLWPLSHGSNPKQFQSLLANASPFQTTLQRLTASGYRRAIVVTGANYRTLLNKQMREQGYSPQTIIVEPSQRNSAAAVLSAAIAVSRTDPDTILFVTPTDHKIDDQAVLDQAVALGLPAVRGGKIVTFGVTPDRAACEYGWIQPSDLLHVISPVRAFIEKPDQTRAQQLLASNNWLWNAGIFLMSARTILKEAAELAPELLRSVTAAVNDAPRAADELRITQASWNRVESHAIDKAIMEKSKKLEVIKVSAGWSDLGNWDSIWRESRKDQRGVVTLGKATGIDCHDSLLRSTDSDGPHLVGIGLNKMIAVATRDSVLVTPRDRAQDAGLGATIDMTGLDRVSPFSRETKPWGSFDILGGGLGYQVKRLTVQPGGQLSLQSHRFRAEHWVVTQGTARVTTSEHVRDVAVNGAVYIEKGEIHRLENLQNGPLVLIEVQVGAHLSEDDITRYSDAYGRA